MQLQWSCEVDRQRCDAISSTLSIAHSDASVAEIDVFNSQPDAFHESESAPVKEPCHQPCGSPQVTKQHVYFIAGQHDRQACRLLGSLNVLQPADLLFEHFFLKKL